MSGGDLRVNMVILVVGNRGTGKTTYLRGDASLKIRGVVQQYLDRSPGTRVLVVDTFDNPVWRDYPAIRPTPAELQGFTGCRRVYSSHTGALLDLINKHVYNCVLIYEDATKFIRRNLSDPTRQFILDSKQKNLDLYFIFHYLGAVPPELAHLADWLVLFKTAETYNSFLKTKFPNPLIEKTFLEVQRQKSYFHHAAVQISGV